MFVLQVPLIWISFPNMESDFLKRFSSPLKAGLNLQIAREDQFSNSVVQLDCLLQDLYKMGKLCATCLCHKVELAVLDTITITSVSVHEEYILTQHIINPSEVAKNCATGADPGTSKLHHFMHQGTIHLSMSFL